MHTVFDIVTQPVMVIDPQGRVAHTNPAFTGATGYTAEEIVGRKPFMFEAGTGQVPFEQAIRYANQSQTGWSGRMRCRCENGSVEPCTLNLKTAALNGSGRRMAVAVFSFDSAGSDTAQNLLLDDETPGLVPQAVLQDRMNQALINARRSGKFIALMIVAMDQYQSVHNAMGAAAGRWLLGEVSARLKRALRASDTVSQPVPGKFAMIMQLTGVKDGVTVADKVLAASRESFEIMGKHVSVSLSAGISLFPEDCDTAAELYDHAEGALEYARLQGGNQFIFFSDQMNEHARNRFEIEHGLRHALEHDELALYYQPKVDVDTERIVGMEGLIRWIDPQRGVVPPGKFISVAEESGLILDLGRWALNQACRQTREWQLQGLPQIEVAVNVSARQFRTGGFVAEVADILAATQLCPSQLELEITESILINDLDQAIEKMLQLRELGVQLAIDDFGTGYSSLSYLSRLPVTTLKIDRAFIADVEKNRRNAEIVRAIIGMSKGLNLKIIGEGAEIAAQVEFLKQNDCSTVQGFYYSRPVTASAFEEMLVAQPKSQTA